MDAELKQVLDGTYELAATPVPLLNDCFRVHNALAIPLLVKSYFMGQVGNSLSVDYGDDPDRVQWFLPGSSSLMFKQDATDLCRRVTGKSIVGDYLICTCAATGAFVTAFKVTPTTGCDNPSTRIDYNIVRPLIALNGIGEPPLPAGDTLIPADSKKFVVAVGKFINPKDQSKVFTVLHEQFWKRSPSSFCIGPNGKKNITVTTTHGRTENTTEESTINSSIGVDVSGGWGPFTASISASLDYSKTVSQSLTLSDSVEVIVDDEYRNETADEERLHVYWTLMDLFSFVQVPSDSNMWSDGQKGIFNIPVVIESAQAPTLLRISRTKLAAPADLPLIASTDENSASR